MRFLLTFILLVGGVVGALAQDSPYARYATPVELLASGTASTNRGAWVSGATNAYDNYGMIYAYCSTCSDATNGARTVLLPPSGIGRWKATVIPPPGGWGTSGADGGGNVQNTGVPVQYALPKYTDTTGTNIGPSLILSDAAGTALTIPSLTLGSVLFAGTGGLVSQDNLNFSWDNTNDRLGVGTATPTSDIQVAKSVNTPVVIESHNPSTGDSAVASFWASSNIGDARLESFGSSNTTSTAFGGMSLAGWGRMRCENALSGFVFQAGNSDPILFGNNLERMRMAGTGEIGIGDSSPVSLLTVGNGDLFQVNSSGDLIRVRNVAYSWPSAQGAASTFLQNDGSGNLSWVTNSAINTAVGTKTLTDNVATDVFTVALAALARSGLEVRFEIDVTNGTDTQTFTDTRRVSAVNKAGTVTSALSASSSATATSSADTLNVTVSVSSTATSYTFVVTADTSLGTPTLTMRYTILNFNGASITIL